MDGLVNFIIGILSNLFTAFKQWAQDIILYILEFVLEGMNQILGWVIDLVLWVLDKVALMCTGFGIDTSSSWSGVPATTIHVLHQVDILSVIQIIICAIMVRSLLNLIPSWATRI